MINVFSLSTNQFQEEKNLYRLQTIYAVKAISRNRMTFYKIEIMRHGQKMRHWCFCIKIFMCLKVSNKWK